MSTRALTVDHLWALPRVGPPVPAPGGARFLVPVTTYRMDADAGTTRLWLVPADASRAGGGGRGDTARPLTDGERSSTQPAWSPDGSRIAFVRKPGESGGGAHHDEPQLHVISAGGGEASRVTDLPLGAADPRWLPDGRRIVFLSPVYLDQPTIEATRARVADRSIVKTPTARVTEDRFYRFWDTWLTDGRRHHLFVVDVESGELVDLTPSLTGWFNPMDPSGQYDLAPNGREIVFTACRSKPPHDPLVWGLFVAPVPPAGRRPRKARPREITPRGYYNCDQPRYAPDGKTILFGAIRNPLRWSERTLLLSYDVRRGRETVLTETWDLSPETWAFTEDGRSIIAKAAVAGRSGFFSLPVKAALSGRGKPREILRGGTFDGLRIAGRRIFTTRSTLKTPPEAASVGIAGADVRRHTAFTAPVMRDLAMGAVEDTTFVGAGGDRVQMFVVHPPQTTGRGAGRGADRPRRRRPLVHLIHGGPHGAFSDQWQWRWCAQVFAARGYVVALVNFHGSDGWGQAFTDSIVGAWADKPYEDVSRATDVLIERGLVDPKRMAATGGSYGGYLASWIASQTDRFACIVNHAGVCDLQTQFASDVPQGWHLSAGGSPWRDQEGMDRSSPLRHAAGFSSPMLVLHGEQDYRVPYDQGLEIYNAYKALKRPARLVCYPDENHWILKPRNSRHWYGEVLDWLSRWFEAGATPARRRTKRS